jgi:molybdopterin-binding protein
LNVLTAEVKEIVSLKRLNLIKFALNKQTLNVLILEMNLDLDVGKKAELIIKPTAVSVLNEKCDFENILKGRVKQIEKGKVLSSVTVEVEGFEMEAITLNKDFKDEVYIVFKANDIAISKVLDD